MSTTSLSWCKHDSGTYYVTTQERVYDIGYQGSPHKFVVAPGTRFNCSIPWLFWWLFDPHDERFLDASCGHDVMLRRGFRHTTAAAEFEAVLRLRGATFIERSLMAWAVAGFSRYY